MEKEKPCCGSEPQREQQEKAPGKELHLDFLYLDLTQCGRCQGTEASLEGALEDVSAVLKSAGYQVILNKVNIRTRELAIRHRFISSPTIRINGRDIALEFRESLCQDCGDLCGDQVDCRVWVYEGEEYDQPPREMIVNAILKEVYGSGQEAAPAAGGYELPANLEAFFQGLEKKEPQ